MTDYTIEVVRDACAVLDTFLTTDEARTLTEIVAETSMSKNKVFRILSTLEECRLVSRTPTGAYNLHVRMMEFGQKVTRQMDVVVASAPLLDWLVEQTKESAYLRIIDGEDALCVSARESSHALRLFARSGERVPVYTGATALVLLAYLPTEERQKLLDRIELTPCTENTITDRDELEKELERIRARGYSVTHEDLFVGASAVGAPVRDFHGNVIAAISVGGLSTRFRGEQLEKMIECVRAAGMEVSRALGYTETKSFTPTDK